MILMTGYVQQTRDALIMKNFLRNPYFRVGEIILYAYTLTLQPDLLYITMQIGKVPLW